MSALNSRLSAWLLAGCACFVAPVYAAYDQPDAEDEPPAIAARLSVADGDVQIWRSDEDGNGAWDEAQINDVVTVSTGLYTGDEARTEVRWGPHALRLDAQSRGGFSRIGYEEAVFNLEYGSLNVRLREEGSDHFAVTVAGLRVDLQSPGRYRIDGRDGQAVRITAFSGRAGLQSQANSLSIAAGQALEVGPGGSSFSYDNAQTTALDDWSRRRDDHFQEVPATRYVSPYMTGYEDLDANGDWATDPTYGTVWYPRVVQVGWVPYRYGRWRWIAPWGWTWVDDAPWGFAPFHYGRWVMVGGRWGWWPGQRVVRPVYAPALVAWVGKPGWSVSVSVGGPAYVGWYPLAPWNVYEPVYTQSPVYRARINQVVMHVPPNGARSDRNLHDGRTIVPGPGFREPIRREYPPRGNTPPLPARDLRPVTAPPPRTGMVPSPNDQRGPIVRPPVQQPQPQPPRGNDGRDKRVPTPNDQRGPIANEPSRPPRTIQPTPQPPVQAQPAPQRPTTPAPQPAPKQPSPRRDFVPTPREQRVPVVEAPRAPVAPTPAPVQRVNPPSVQPPVTHRPQPVAPQPAAPQAQPRGPAPKVEIVGRPAAPRQDAPRNEGRGERQPQGKEREAVMR